jgi:uncharacterized protein (DUF952 family)
MTLIYKIVAAPVWRASTRLFRGAGVDLCDGFIHFSTSTQVATTAARHYAGQSDLLLVAVAAERLGDALKWEISRGGDLFPHLYGELPVAAVVWVKPLPLDVEGGHDFSGLLS